MLNLLAASVALAALSGAAPSLQKGFTISQVETDNKKFLSGPMAMRATYLKYGKPVPANIEAAAAAAAVQQGSVSANPEQYDSEYLCPVQIGTAGVTLMLDFDTGSSDLWAFSSLQPSSQTSGHTLYNPSKSSTSKLLSGETWNIAYQDGSGAKGVIYSDKVVIGGVTATSQAVEAATSVSTSFSSEVNNDGLVGLAFDSINTAKPNRVATFMDNVKSSLPSPIFAVTLKKGKAGTYDFGYIDSSKYTGSITYTAVNNANGFWEFTTSGYSVGSTSYSGAYDSIADTGTTLIYLPDAVINNYWGSVSGAQYSSGAGGVIFPCGASLPTLSITISGAKHTVPGSYLNYAPYSGGYCFGGLQSSSGIGLSILGDIFLKSQYVVFDVSTPKIGFAAQAGV